MSFDGIHAEWWPETSSLVPWLQRVPETTLVSSVLCCGGTTSIVSLLVRPSACSEDGAGNAMAPWWSAQGGMAASWSSMHPFRLSKHKEGGAVAEASEVE